MMIGMFGVLYSVFIGFAIGSLMISKRILPTRLQGTLVTIFFAISVYLGFFIGRIFISFLPVRLVEILIGLILIAIVSLAFVHFHPMMGYFHQQSRMLWGVLFFLFLLFGIEWKLQEISIWFQLIAVLFFYFSVSLGQLIQYGILQNVWRVEYISYLPLLYFVLIALFKIF